jgi:hypothetical protein
MLNIYDMPKYQIIISHSNTLVQLYDDGLHHHTSDLVTQNKLPVIDMSCINSTTIQELCQALSQSIGLFHMLAN